MAVRRILRMGHPNLRKVAQPIDRAYLETEEFEQLVFDMEDTLHDYGGVGLAAPQIDVDLQLALIQLPGGPTRYGELPEIPLTVFVNPKVTIVDEETQGYWEGCLSIPGLRGFVERPQHVLVDYLDARGDKKALELEGFPATVVQHELDHLKGTLYIDHISDTRNLSFEAEFERFHVG